MRQSPAVNRIPVGISSCLLGEAVRYDGRHKYDQTINTCLSDYFVFRPFCPEVAIGLGIPREPIQLVRTKTGIAVRGITHPGMDITQPLAAYGVQVAADNCDLCGYIFKARSPSCGLKHVRTVDESGGAPRTDGTGAFAAALMQAWPGLPVIEEGALLDVAVREDFIEQAFGYYHRQQRDG